MDPQITAALIAAASTVIVTTIGSLMATHRQITKIMSEFRPNGGGSLKDQLNRLEDSHQKLEQRVDRIYDILSNKKNRD